MPPALTIGQLAKATGVASKTIRYYEQIGVLPTPSRSAARYRQYDQSGVQRLRFIRRARSLRVPLREIKTLVTALEEGRPGSSWPCSASPVSSSYCSSRSSKYCTGC
jgi:DNA-binding transcriptional MerR regulator